MSLYNKDTASNELNEIHARINEREQLKREIVDEVLAAIEGNTDGVRDRLLQLLLDTPYAAIDPDCLTMAKIVKQAMDASDKPMTIRLTKKTE